MGKLTSRVLAPSNSLTDLIHVVLTGDTSQSPSGSSYKAKIGDYLDLVPKPFDVFVTSGTYNNGTGEATFLNNTGGTFTVSGFLTATVDVFVTGGTYDIGTGIATYTNNTGGTFTVAGFSTHDVFVTGGTYDVNTGVATFVNNTGGTFTVVGFTTTSTDVFITGGTYADGITTYKNNTGGTFTIDQRFTENIPVVLKGANDTLGKYHNGQTIPSNGKSIEWIIKDIATDFIPPTFSAFSRANFSPTVLDLGQTIPNGVQTFTWSTTTPNNINPTTLTLTQNISATQIGTGLNYLGGSAPFNTTDVIISNTPVENKLIYTISGIDNNATVFSRTINASWRYRWYYGKSVLPDLATQADVTGLSSTGLIVGVQNSFVNVGTSLGSYIYLVIPSTIPQPTDFRDSVSGCFGNNIPFTNLGLINVTNFSVATSYYKYRSINTIDGAISIWMCA